MKDLELQGSLDFHISMFVKFVEALDLKKFTIVGQDWGGPIVAGIAARLPKRINSAVFANTSIVEPRRFSTSWFHKVSHIPLLSDILFRLFGFPIQFLWKVQGNPKSIGSLERAAYEYPFKHWRNRWSPLLFARMVPTNNKHPSIPVLHEIMEWAKNFQGEVGLIWGVKDPILGGVIRRMKETFPKAIVIETDAGHFLQEEVPEKISSIIAKIIYKD